MTDVLSSQLKFSVNLSFLLTEITDLRGKYEAAKNAGFTGVEFGTEIYDFPIKDLIEANKATDLSNVVINAFQGKNKGIACIPNRGAEFRQCLELSIQYCNALKCKRLHIQAGQYPSDSEITVELEELYRKTYLENLLYASQRLRQENITILIEAISNIPNYFLTRTDQAFDVIKELECSNIQLQFDIFHHQMTHGDVIDALTTHLAYIGNIQIAQAPHRDEPDRAGDLDFSFIFNHLVKIGYQGWIACEYHATAVDEKKFDWLSACTQTLREVRPRCMSNIATLRHDIA